MSRHGFSTKDSKQAISKYMEFNYPDQNSNDGLDGVVEYAGGYIKINLTFRLEFEGLWLKVI
jgi:hypothetical protein